MAYDSTKRKAYYEANKEKVKASNKAYREANKEKAIAYAKAYYEANKEKVTVSNKAYREANKEKSIAYAKAYRKANKEKLSSNNKKYYLKVKYGITLKEKNFILKKQNNKCKICKITIHKNKKLKNNTACIDHCHTTNKLRGILCSMCNKGLGHFKDNTEILTNAIDYLKEAETLPEEFKQ